MKNNTRMYEVAQMMRDRNVVQKDLNEAVSMIQGMFRDRYISRLQDAVMEHRTSAQQNPPMEIQLMQALKPFMPEEKQQSIEKAIEMVLMMNTFSNIRDEMSMENMQSMPYMPDKAPGYQNSDGSIHRDGVYDVDNVCLSERGKNQPRKPVLNNMTGMFLMMSMMGML